jgi:Septum formation
MGQTARALIAMVVVVGVIGGAWWLFRDRLSGSAEDLRVGDCFDVPSEETVSSIQHQPCTDPHDGEVYVVGASDAESYPIVFGFDDWVQEHCLGEPFTSFVGEPAEARPDIDIGYFSPTSDGWESGDREITCYLTPADGEPVSSSYQAGAPPS